MNYVKCVFIVKYFLNFPATVFENNSSMLLPVAVLLASQQVERINDPVLVTTGRSAVLDIGSVWVKPDGRWVEYKNGMRIEPIENSNGFAKRRLFNLRIKASGFKKGNLSYALVSVITYDDASFEGGWIPILPTYRQLVFVVKGPLGDQPKEGEPSVWKLPMLRAWTADGDKIMPYWQAAKEDMKQAADQYAFKSFLAMAPSFEKSGASSQILSWPVWSIAPKAGKVVRYQFPIESAADLNQDWNRFYIETNPDSWASFVNELTAMTASRPAIN